MGEPTGMVIGHEPLGVVEEVGSLEQAPEAYRHFDARRDGYLKIVIRPG